MTQENVPITFGSQGHLAGQNYEHTHISLNSRYEIQFEQAASATKGVLGFKVVAHGDTLEDVKQDIRVLLQEALDNTKPIEVQKQGVKE